MKMDARGSNPFQPKWLMSNVEMMTPTEPSVSAMTCWEGVPLKVRTRPASARRGREAHQKDAVHVVAMTVRRVSVARMIVVLVVLRVVVPRMIMTCMLW